MSYHVFPLGDLIEHDTEGDDCVCGPTATPVEQDDGGIAWMTVHHSLDGREQREGRRFYRLRRIGGRFRPR